MDDLKELKRESDPPTTLDSSFLSHYLSFTETKCVHPDVSAKSLQSMLVRKDRPDIWKVVMNLVNRKHVEAGSKIFCEGLIFSDGIKSDKFQKTLLSSVVREMSRGEFGHIRISGLLHLLSLQQLVPMIVGESIFNELYQCLRKSKSFGHIMKSISIDVKVLRRTLTALDNETELIHNHIEPLSIHDDDDFENLRDFYSKLDLREAHEETTLLRLALAEFDVSLRNAFLFHDLQIIRNLDAHAVAYGTLEKLLDNMGSFIEELEERELSLLVPIRPAIVHCCHRLNEHLKTQRKPRQAKDKEQKKEREFE